MTLPALVNQYQKQVTVSKLKRFYTSVKQVETQVKADFGELNYVTNLFYPNGDLVVIDKFFKPYLKISKVCNNDCIYSYLDASSVSHDMSDKNGFYTSDGILVLISEFHIGYEWDSSTTWGAYMIDINGTVAPNKEGRDVFWANYQINYTGRGGNSQTLLLPPIHAGYECNSFKKNGCFAKIVEDGWTIADDYPW